MPKNQIDQNGIQVQEYEEIFTDIVEGLPDVLGYKQIYGNDINVDSNSPDGQQINIYTLSKKDILDLMVQFYNDKNPDTAVGIGLDAVSQLCGLHRKGGTYTESQVIIVVDRSLNLQGLDTTTPFTISDVNGNLFYLISSVSIGSGANTLNFRCATIGFFQLQQNTLTRIVTTTLGVISANNPSVPYSVGEDQETDAIFRVRRQKSTALPARGALQGLYAGLGTVSGLAEVVVYENTDNSIDVNTVPAHSIWVIVDGGSDTDVGEMIYRYRDLGVGMKGSVAYVITQIDNSTFTVYFDRAVYENLYIKFTVTSLTGGIVDTAALKQSIVNAYNLTIYEAADVTTLASIVKNIDPNLVITEEGVSVNNSDFFSYLFPTEKKNKFVLATDRITIS